MSVVLVQATNRETRSRSPAARVAAAPIPIVCQASCTCTKHWLNQRNK